MIVASSTYDIRLVVVYRLSRAYEQCVRYTFHAHVASPLLLKSTMVILKDDVFVYESLITDLVSSLRLRISHLFYKKSCCRVDGDQSYIAIRINNQDSSLRSRSLGYGAKSHTNFQSVTI